MDFLFIHTIKHLGIYETFPSRSYYGVTDWKKICFKIGTIKKLGINQVPYTLSIYIYPSIENSEGYIDDISLTRFNFKIGINNDRDEVYDKVIVSYRIYANKETYNFTDFEIKTRIKDDNKIFVEKSIKISSFSFTDSIDIKKLNLKDNNYYKIESILNNKNG